MRHNRAGIVGYGVYIPRERIETEKIVREREKKRKDLPDFLQKVREGLLLKYKSIAGLCEDTTTIATEAAENAIRMAQISPERIGSVAVGSESKPYAVGTIARHIASFVGIGLNVYVSDLEGACNAGMQAVNFVESQIQAGLIEYGLAVGADVAQAPKGDPLEYAAGAGAGAFVLGKNDLLATIEDMAPYSSLTMDFWRREESPVPRHFGRTTVDAYIRHVIGAMEELLKRHPELKIRDFDHITFHQPSGYMPLKTCKTLTQPNIDILRDRSVEDRIRLTPEDIEQKVKPWLRVLDTGNTYAASTPIAVASILDKAKPGDDVLAVSYGSGAYTIATWLKVQDGIESKRGLVPSVDEYVNRRVEIKLETYHDQLTERLRRVRKRLMFPRIMGEIEPLSSDSIDILMCSGCERIYYPVRDGCLEADCKGTVEKKSLPKRARLKSFKRLPLKKIFTSNYEILKQGKVILVDSGIKDLAPGIELEPVIRRLDYEGKDGLIIYGPCYRPLFRDAFPMTT